MQITSRKEHNISVTNPVRITSRKEHPISETNPVRIDSRKVHKTVTFDSAPKRVALDVDTPCMQYPVQVDYPNPDPEPENAGMVETCSQADVLSSVRPSA